MRTVLAFLLPLMFTLPAHAAGLSLKQAIDRALSTHPDLVRAVASESQAKLSVEDAHSQRWSLSSELSAGDRYAQGGLLGQGNLPEAQNQFTANGMLQLQVPLFTGFKITRGIEQAESGYLQTQASREQAVQDLKRQVITAYWSAKRAEMQVAVQKEALAQTERSLELVKKSHALGRATARDVDRAEVSVLSAKGDVLRLEGQDHIAREELATLLGLPARDITLTEEPSIESTAIAGSVSQRPDLRVAEARVAASRAAVGVAEADRWPQIALQSSYQHGNNPFIPISGNRNILNQFEGTWDARFVVSHNLFDNGRIGRQIESRRLDLADAEAQRERLRREADLEVSRAKIRLANAMDRIRNAERTVDLAQKTLAWVETRFEQGYSLQVEVNDARLSLVNARTQHIDATIDALNARADLARAMGSL